MEKIWLKEYQKQVPTEINADAYASIVHLFEECCEKFQSNPALRNFGVELSYGTLLQRANDFAAYCQHELRLQKGQRIAIMMPNLIQYLIVMFGAMKAGLVVVNVNPLYTASELVHQMNDSGAEVLVVLEHFAHTVQEALPEMTVRHVITTEVADCFPFLKRVMVNFAIRYVKKMIPAWSIPGTIPFRNVMAVGAKHQHTPVALSGDDIAFLQYTGGTTGVAKGAVLTHRNMIANVEQAYAWSGHHLQEGKEIIVTALPLYHIFSLTANALAFLKLGPLNVLITNPRDLASFIKELASTPFTAFTGVNTLFNALLNRKNFQKVDFSHLKITLGGGMAVQHDVARRWQEMTGNSLLQAYGLTESSPAVCINPMHLTEFNGSIGLPLPSTEISIRNEAGEAVPQGDVGELCVRGPQVMREYWNKPEETAQVFYKDGFLRTGDVAKVDEKGFVYLVDRIKDMIIVSGFKVYPNEVEDVIAMHPGISEVGVVGISLSDGKEVVTAFVVRNDENVTRDDVISFSRKNLPRTKCQSVLNL